MYVYLLHFEKPISDRHTCQHYIGFCRSIDQRLSSHRAGRGARLTAVAVERGIGIKLAAYWFGGREMERRLKRQHNARRYCPICKAREETS